MSDNFGRIMLDNLRNRGCQLAGVDACLSSQTQMDRFDCQIINLNVLLSIILMLIGLLGLDGIVHVVGI